MRCVCVPLLPHRSECTIFCFESELSDWPQSVRGMCVSNRSESVCSLFQAASINKLSFECVIPLQCITTRHHQASSKRYHKRLPQGMVIMFQNEVFSRKQWISVERVRPPLTRYEKVKMMKTMKTK